MEQHTATLPPAAVAAGDDVETSALEPLQRSPLRALAVLDLSLIHI